MAERTPEEREAARRERERRRALRQGRPWPPDPPPTTEIPPAGAFDPPPAPPASTPAGETWSPAPDEAAAPPLRHDAWSPAPSEAAAPPPPAEEPQPTEMFDVTSLWTGEHATVGSPPQPAPEPAPPHDPPPVSAPEPLPAHEPPILPDDEAPLGTRRVTARERAAGRRRATGGGARGGRRGRGRPPAPPRTARRASRSPGRRWGGRVAALAAIAVVVVAGWFLWSLYQPGAGEGSGRVSVTIPRGATVSEIGDLLADRGVIDSPFFFGLRAKLSGSAGELKSGTFTLRRDMSYGAAIERLKTTPPPPPVIRITIPEGRSRSEIAALARQAGLRGDYMRASRRSPELDPTRYGAPRGATLEGFLFPATYELRRGATVRNLVAQQLLAFRQNLAKVDLRYARSKNLTVFDVLTIASMIEREVAVARERPLVAAVIYNRLRQGIPLGIDATIRFEHDNWTRPLRQSELTADTPYNTRTRAGLPPGPIGNPGLASIEAAAHPARVDYLYYVVKPGTCGEHAFSSTDAQFQRDVAAYNSARERAGGKSPTRC